MAEMDEADDNSTFEISKLELTRNPFDSNLYEKENFPSFSPSILANGDTPKSDSSDFRWSIDQIATMNPTAIEECPLQEYSVSYEHKEDEIKEQKEIDNYFASLTLPSPWLHQNVYPQGSDLKQVTFSPHPPMTRIIHKGNDSSLSSCNSLEQTGVTFLVDASCQTNLTLPCDFDLETLIGKEFYCYDETTEVKRPSFRSLRRTLFEQNDVEPIDYGHPIEKTPIKQVNTCTSASNYVTSSPVKEEGELNDSSNEFLDADEGLSPCSVEMCSNIDSSFSTPERGVFDVESINHSPKTSFTSIDMSPIQNPEGMKNKPSFGENSLILDGSPSFDDTNYFRRESSRGAFSNFTPDVSPIKEETRLNSEHPEKAGNTFNNLDFSCINVEQTMSNVDMRINSTKLVNVTDFDEKGDCMIEEFDQCDLSEICSSSKKCSSENDVQSNITGANVTPLKSILKRRPNDILDTDHSFMKETNPNTCSLTKLENSSEMMDESDALINSRPIPHFSSSFATNSNTKTKLDRLTTETCEIQDKENNINIINKREIETHVDEASILSPMIYEDNFAKKKGALKTASHMQSTFEHATTSDSARHFSLPHDVTITSPISSTSVSPLKASKGIPKRKTISPDVSKTLHKYCRPDFHKLKGSRKTHTPSPNLQLDLLSLQSRSPAFFKQSSKRKMHRAKTWPRQIYDKGSYSPAGPNLAHYKRPSINASHYPTLKDDSLCNYDDALDDLGLL